MVRSHIDKAVEAASEALTLGDLAHSFVPLVEEALDGSGSLLFEFDETGRPRAVSGSLASHIAGYNETLFGQDPLQTALRSADPSGTTVRLEDVLSYDALRASAAFQEFYRPLGVEQLMGVWPTGQRFGAPGMVGLVVGRPLSARRFGERERRIYERVLPALRAAIARDRRLRERDRERAYAALAFQHVVRQPIVVLDARGTIRWMSAHASAWLRDVPDASAVTRALAHAARRAMRAGACPGAGDAIVLPTSHRSYDARVWLDRSAGGDVSIVIVVDDDRTSHDDVVAAARRLGLTATEASVLACVARGLDNRSIADEMHVAESTVKTHLRQILAKLGVESRTQAALLVHGVLPRERG